MPDSHVNQPQPKGVPADPNRETVGKEGTFGNTGIKLAKAWILVETERWYDGWPCIRVYFTPQGVACGPPLEEGCWLAGYVEWQDGQIREDLNKPRFNSLQETVWDAVIAWAQRRIKETNSIPEHHRKGGGT